MGGPSSSAIIVVHVTPLRLVKRLLFLRSGAFGPPPPLLLARRVYLLLARRQRRLLNSIVLAALVGLRGKRTLRLGWRCDRLLRLASSIVLLGGGGGAL